MIVMVSRAQALARRHRHVTPNGTTTFVSTYMGTNAMELAAQGKAKDAVAQLDTPYPMAYLVEQAPDSTVEPHYHQVDQFQLFVGGGGQIGTQALAGVTVHYAGAHSPYGPIVAGPAGVQYITLRRSWDPGAQWMPAAAAVLRDLPHRQHLACTSPPLERCAEQALARLAGASATEVIPARESGLGAWVLRAGPGAAVAVDPAAGGGQFWYVLAGGLQAGAAQLDAGACIFISGGEEPLAWRAAASGAELVRMQFPRT